MNGKTSGIALQKILLDQQDQFVPGDTAQQLDVPTSQFRNPSGTYFEVGQSSVLCTIHKILIGRESGVALVKRNATHDTVR